MAGARRPRSNPRPNKGIGGMPGQGLPGGAGPSTGPHMEFGQMGQDTGHGNRQMPQPGGMPGQAGVMPNTPPRPPRPNFGGFDSKAAQTAASTAFYGAGSNIMAHKNNIEQMMAAQGLNQGQPVGLGGMRFYDNAGDLTTTGERSDVPYGDQPLGSAYDSGIQSYFPGYGQRRPRRPGTTGQVLY